MTINSDHLTFNMQPSSGLVVGIDAANSRSGGGVTYLIELLEATVPSNQGIAKIIIWGCEQTLDKLPEHSWLEKISPVALNRGLLSRSWWQRFSLSRMAKAAQCDVLFVPGGNYAGKFRPMVTMNQNLLPFEWRELLRYEWSLMTVKFILLRMLQSRSFRNADGVIFLTEYARQAVLRVTGKLTCVTTIIPHGLSPRFLMPPKAQYPLNDYSTAKPYRLLYVSTVDQYKHQWHVVEAVHFLRQEGYPVVLELAGPAYPPAFERLKATMMRFDPEGVWAHYHGAVPYETLHTLYSQADLGLFASSCETFGIILLESMATGLPIACSNRSAMPEVLDDAGLYFDPEKPAEIAQVLRTFINSVELRSEKANAGFERCQQYPWSRCANDTFSFIVQTAKQYTR